MFTGIVQAKRQVHSIEDHPGLRRIVVALGEALYEGLQRGASVAIDGVCLTAVDLDDTHHSASFDIMLESLNKTTLGSLSQGDLVHVERSARFGDEVGGHIVSGHVSGMARVIGVERMENNFVLRLQLPEGFERYVFSKGFIAIKGCSLTVVDLDPHTRSFSVWLIPETLALTTFGSLEIDDSVNIEVDPQTVTIVETIERIMRAQQEQKG